MAESHSADELLDQILRRDRRYTRDAYVFVSESLNFTVRKKKGQPGHVTGRELCEGLCEYALEQFGRLARTVLDTWGVRQSGDIGEIVFNLVGVGLLKKTDEDRREDFVGVIDFEQALVRGFELHVKSGESDELDAQA